jgi:hypothetical protein
MGARYIIVERWAVLESASTDEQSRLLQEIHAHAESS